MATSTGKVPFAIDGSSLSPVHDAVAAGPSTLQLVLIAIALAAVLVGVVGVLAYVRQAEDDLEDELAEVAAERDAYLAFADVVNELSVSQGSAAMATPQTVQTFENEGPPISAVQSAFEETVMAVDHYEETYGEPWLAHVSAELDPDLAASLRTHRTVNPPIKRALEQRSVEAASKRDDLISVLTTERTNLDDAASTLASIEARLEDVGEPDLATDDFDDLANSYDELTDLAERTERFARRRQRQIQRQTRTGHFDGEELSLQEYLYGSLPSTYPVLDAALRLDDRIRRSKRRVVDALTATV
ncbi:MAG: hypothetical protein ABEJ67_02995 [Halanaeroarchaeum sp.]